MTDDFDLTGRRAVVTGGSRGLGRAICHGLAARGADIVVASRKLATCQVLAETLIADYGVRALAVACDVGRWDECDRLIDTVNDAWGGMDVLVNNAGMSPLYDDVTEVSEALFDKVVAVNFKGPFRLAARCGRDMVERGQGTIVNISSVGAVRPTPDVVPYAAAKAALNSITESLAYAFAPTVRVNGVMPGRFRTDIAKHWTPDVIAAAERSLALRRIGEPDEIVGAVLYLASAASSYTTGTVVRVDGGYG